MKAAVLFLGLIPCLTATADDTPDFSGLTSADLLRAVNMHCRPDRMPGADYAADVWTGSDGSTVCAFGGDEPLYPLLITPQAWWDADIGYDLHNSVLGDSRAATGLTFHYPGAVEHASLTTDSWCAGTGHIGNVETYIYEPPRGYEGDFARAIMYMAAVYPSDFRNAYGAVMFSDGLIPGLTPYASGTLLAMHRADPADDAERAREARAAVLQGNHNPFVTHPALAEYIWGSSAGTPWPGSDTPPLPDLEPLKARYSISADTRICLYSPLVTDRDVVWAIDGVVQTDTYVPLKSISAGRHEITYTGRQSRGYLIITVEK